MPERGVWLRLGLLAAIVGAALLVAWQLGFFHLRDPAALAAAIREMRQQPYIFPLFLLIYAAAATVGVPGSALTLAGGAIFGTALGTAANWLGAVLGATGAYLLARALGRDALRSLIGRRAEALDRMVAAKGFLTLLRLRLIPVVPFNALNFGAGFAGVPAREYLAATALGILPGTLVYTWFADSLVRGVAGARGRALVHATIAGAILILLTFVARRAAPAGRRPGTGGTGSTPDATG